MVEFIYKTYFSYESGILENPKVEAPKDLYMMTKDPQEAAEKPEQLEISFKHGKHNLLVISTCTYTQLCGRCKHLTTRWIFKYHYTTYCNL